MQKNQYQKYKSLLRIRDMVIVVVLIFVGLFYYFAQADGGTDPVQMYRAETAVQEEDASAAETAGSEIPGTAALETQTVSGAAGSGGVAADSAMSEAAVPPESIETGVAVTAAETAVTPETAAGDTRINLNTASLEELDSLPGIGPATAKLILEYRQQYGGFAAPEEIKNVKRIGDKTYEKLKDHIRV